MFQGTIPPDTRKILTEAVSGWRCSDIGIGCSGNFTVERVLHTHGRFALHGCDVSIYTSTLGCYFAGEPTKLTISPLFKPLVGWLEPYLKSPAAAVATMMLATRLGEVLTPEGSVRDTPYHQRIYRAMCDQWDAMFAKTLSTVESNDLSVQTFAPQDAVDWVGELPQSHGVITYPPFYAAGYEKLYQDIDAMFNWEDRPAYANMTEDRMMLYLERVTNRKHWMFGVKFKVNEYDNYLVGVTQTTARGVPIYVYSSQSPKRVIAPRQKTAPVHTPRLSTGDVIGDTPKIAVLSLPQFNALRSKYLDPHIAPAMPSEAYALLIDDKLVSVFAFSAAQGLASLGDGRGIYMMTDFAVEPTDYPRLSKLSLYAALSKEARVLAERLTNRRVNAVYTTAFSQNPVSMKYRGVMDVYTRREAAEGDPHNYVINYVGAAGQWSLAEGLQTWKKKHGKRHT